MEDVENISKRLILAASKGKLEIVRQLINSYGLTYSKNWSQGYALLNYALCNKHTEVAKLLLVSGSKVNGKCRNRQMNANTPLHFAVINSDIEIVKMLLKKKAKVNAKNNTGNTPLFYAIENADVNSTKLLLSNRANIKDNPELLINAIQNNYLEIVEAIIHYDVDINAVDERGWTALHFTTSRDIKNSSEFLTNEDPIINVKTEIVKLLLSKGANVNAKTKDGLTALHMATQSRCQKVIEVLLQYKADINIRDKTGRTALHFSAICEIRDPPQFYFIDDTEHKIRGEIAKLLLSKRANVNAKTQIGQTTLHLAAQNGYIKVVEALLQYNADINAGDTWERTALHFTALDDFKRDFSSIQATADHFINIKAEIAKLLLSKGANVNAETDRGLTTLHAATEAGFLQVVEVLLEYDVDVNISDINGMTALHFTVVKRSLNPIADDEIDVKTKIAKLLLSKGANANPKNGAGLTVLHAATKRGLLEVVEALLEYDADVNDFDRYRRTALHYTVGTENLSIDQKFNNIDDLAKIVKLLLSNGADVNAKTIDCITALHIATARGYEKIVETLLEHNANVNCKSSDGFTPLHHAAENGFQEIINIILNFGADVNSVDECGRTALFIASIESHFNVVTTLLDHGTKFNFISVYSQIYIVSDFDKSNYVTFEPFFFRDDPDNYPYPEYNFLVEQTLDIYKREVIKLEAANLYVSKKNLELLRCDYMTDYKAKCEKEIANMKCENIDNFNISFYDILVKDTTLLAKIMRNEKIVQVLKSKKYEIKFPEYAERITCNIKKAMYRKELQEKGIEILNLFFNTPESPHDCSEKIIDYLNYEDIRTLFNACKHNQQIRWSFTKNNNL